MAATATTMVVMAVGTGSDVVRATTEEVTQAAVAETTDLARMSRTDSPGARPRQKRPRRRDCASSVASQDIWHETARRVVARRDQESTQ